MDFPGDEGSWSSRNQRTRVSEARRGHHQSRYVVVFNLSSSAAKVGFSCNYFFSNDRLLHQRSALAATASSSKAIINYWQPDSSRDE
ncbi:hypothetical protein QJS10_CPB18g00186 [Acorus calamus]|uniref:Uncharacterized protein n=1 Tax=Acorus calamus TaxID=4465 RepID=A0AAV9CLQ3_ACOCL|nr:hypothetical protein QJS10_CPB18g00186 [Acorus calamus]